MKTLEKESHQSSTFQNNWFLLKRNAIIAKGTPAKLTNILQSVCASGDTALALSEYGSYKIVREDVLQNRMESDYMSRLIGTGWVDYLDQVETDRLNVISTNGDGTYKRAWRHATGNKYKMLNEVLTMEEVIQILTQHVEQCRNYTQYKEVEK